MTSGRSVLLIAAGIVGIVVLGVVIVLLAEGREPQAYEPGTPEAAMQAYLAAWDNDDASAAYDYFSNRSRQPSLARTTSANPAPSTTAESIGPPSSTA